MGSYFEDVYLKRINLNGNNQQDRVKTRKEKEFDKLFLKKTEYLAKIYKINDESCEIACSLQPNKWNENNLVSNLLISTSARELQTGDILQISQKIKEKENDLIWLVFFVEKNLTKGYQLFKVICLDSVVSLADEHGTTKYSFPVKFVSATSQFVIDQFVHSATQLGYREPQGNRFFITKDFDFLQKSSYFNYKEKGWEISGIDNISIDNVAYVTISEKLVVPPEPISSGDITVGWDKNFFLNGT